MEEKAGTVKWSQGEFEYSLSLESRGHGRATWILWAGDQYFRQVRARGSGAARLIIRPLAESTFPITNASYDLDQFTQEIGVATSFISDREDFCRILMSEGSVTRGGIEAWQMPSNYPARLAEALILSRILGSSDIEREILDQISNAPDANEYGKLVPAIDSVRRWLDDYSRDIDIKVDI
jgi:hypothetical protein